MSEAAGAAPGFLTTKEYRRFEKFCGAATSRISRPEAADSGSAHESHPRAVSSIRAGETKSVACSSSSAIASRRRSVSTGLVPGCGGAATRLGLSRCAALLAPCDNAFMNVGLRRPMTLGEFLAGKRRQELRCEFNGNQTVALDDRRYDQAFGDRD